MDRQSLQRLHARLGISQAKLGRELQISQPQVSRALSGASPLSREASVRAYKLAEEYAPEVVSDARLIVQTTKALQESESFRSLVRAALALIHQDE